MSSFGSTPQRGSSSFGVGGTTLPNTGSTSVLRNQEVARRNQEVARQNQAISEARRVAGNQQFQREKQARSQQNRQAFLKERRQQQANILSQVQQNQGRQEARIFQQNLERANRLGERVPLPEGVPVDFTNQGQLDKLREAGFDVPKRVAPAGGGGGGGFAIPSGRFPVDRVSAGSDFTDSGPRLRPQPQPEPEPAPTQSRDNALARTQTGGASGGLTASVERDFDEFVASRSKGANTNPFGNVGLAGQRSVPIGVGSGLTEAEKKRDAELIAQLEAEPRSSPRGR